MLEKAKKRFPFLKNDVVLARYGNDLFYAKILSINYKRKLAKLLFDDDSKEEIGFKKIFSVKAETSDIICIICRKDVTETDNNLVLCDRCNVGYHQLCHEPIIASDVLSPEVPWQCVYCTRNQQNPFVSENPFDNTGVDDQFQKKDSQVSQKLEPSMVSSEEISDNCKQMIDDKDTEQTKCSDLNNQTLNDQTSDLNNNTALKSLHTEKDIKMDEGLTFKIESQTQKIEPTISCDDKSTENRDISEMKGDIFDQSIDLSSTQRYTKDNQRQLFMNSETLQKSSVCENTQDTTRTVRDHTEEKNMNVSTRLNGCKLPQRRLSYSLIDNQLGKLSIDEKSTSFQRYQPQKRYNRSQSVDEGYNFARLSVYTDTPSCEFSYNQKFENTFPRKENVDRILEDEEDSHHHDLPTTYNYGFPCEKAFDHESLRIELVASQIKGLEEEIRRKEKEIQTRKALLKSSDSQRMNYLYIGRSMDNEECEYENAYDIYDGRCLSESAKRIRNYSDSTTTVFSGAKKPNRILKRAYSEPMNTSVFPKRTKTMIMLPKSTTFCNDSNIYDRIEIQHGHSFPRQAKVDIISNRRDYFCSSYNPSYGSECYWASVPKQEVFTWSHNRSTYNQHH